MSVRSFREKVLLATTRLASSEETSRVSVGTARALLDIVCMCAHSGSRRGINSSHVTFGHYRAAICLDGYCRKGVRVIVNDLLLRTLYHNLGRRRAGRFARTYCGLRPRSNAIVPVRGSRGGGGNGADSQAWDLSHVPTRYGKMFGLLSLLLVIYYVCPRRLGLHSGDWRVMESVILFVLFACFVTAAGSPLK